MINYRITADRFSRVLPWEEYAPRRRKNRDIACSRSKVCSTDDWRTKLGWISKNVCFDFIVLLRWNLKCWKQAEQACSMVRGRCLGIRQLTSPFATLLFPNEMVKGSPTHLQKHANMTSLCLLCVSFFSPLSLSLFVHAVLYCADLNRDNFMLLRQLYGVPSPVNDPLGSAAQLSEPSSVHWWFNGQRPNCESLRCSSCSIPLWSLYGFPVEGVCRCKGASLPLV